MSEKPPASNDKTSRWDRPKPPHDWRWAVGGIGRILITLGLMMFAFVAYQLWGTGIQTARAQHSLAAQFDKALATGAQSTPVTTTTTTPGSTPDSTVPLATSATPVPTSTTAAILPPAKPVPDIGEGVARLEIPRISLNRIVVEGATAGDLKKGPGHFPETPLPGQLGNAAIAGHRTTNLAPFFDIDSLQPGDEIKVTTLNGQYVYKVTGTEVVAPTDYALVIPTVDITKATLTLVSCTPRYSATNRIVVRSELAVDLSDPLTVATPVTPPVPGSDVTLPVDSTPVTAGDTVPATSVAGPGSAPDTGSGDIVPAVVSPVAGPTGTPDAFTDGWFSDKTAIPQALLWGLGLATVAVAIYWISRLARRYWLGILIGFAPFVIALYFFYENVNRLLPPNL
jgi:sortase A